MGPGLGADLALEPLLDAVVADGGGGVEAVGDVLLGDPLDQGLAAVGTGLGGGVVGPQAGVAVGLELEADGAALGPGGAAAAGPVHRPGEVLDVVPVLVGQHVRLGERAAPGAEAALELPVEAEVDVDGAVPGAVEGADLGAGRAAAGLGAAGEQRGRRELILAAAPLELGRPVLLEAVDHGHDPAVLLGVGVRPRLALLGELGLLALDLVDAGQGAGGGAAPAEQLDQDEQDHPDEPGPAADGDPAAAREAAAAAGVLDL